MYKLIIVEDEPETRTGLCRYFPWAETGFEVAAAAADGASAIKYIRENPVDAALCDIKMPNMDGLEFARRLSEEYPNIEIIFLSGYRDFEYAKKALQYNVTDYLVKPTKYDEIKQAFMKLKKKLDSKNLELPGLSYHENILHSIKKYIASHYRDAALEELAGVVNMNPQYLSKYIKEKTGYLFSEHLLMIRMEKARELLDDIRLKTYKISGMLGYKNPKNFTRAFKKYYGCTPKEYKEGSKRLKEGVQ